MKTTLVLGSTTYTLCVPDTVRGDTSENAMQNRITDVKALHAKYAKPRRSSSSRNNGGRVYPPNGANVSVREYCEQYHRANARVFGGAYGFSKETLDFFAPLSANRCYVQGEFSEEVAA